MRSTLAITAVISVAVSFVTVIFGKFLMRMFTDDPAVIELGRGYLAVIGSFYILFSTMFVLNGIMRGAGDTLIPMFISLIALWVIRIPIATMLSSHHEIGIYGVYWSMPIGWFVGASLSFIYFLTGRWKKKTVVKYSASGERVE